MCGICGAWMRGSGLPLEEGKILAMRESMTHRGPDDGAHWISPDGHLALGSRRLAILDLSPSGRMPLWNEDGTVGIVFNGECYNYGELREWLIQRGHRFRSQSDTESVLHLYEESKTPEEMLNRLRGMYAFAIWDSPRRRLLLARDRLGIKPLYYSLQEKGIVFASEVRALLASGMVSRELDPAGIQGYFAMGACPGPYTPLAQVKALPAGHYLLMDNAKEVLKSYWRLQFQEEQGIGEAEWLEKIQSALLDSVRRHLVADVPVGIFASGGIDSSSLIALARHVEQRRLRTYSIVFGEQEFSEAVFARQVARTYETEHHEQTVGPEEILQKLDAAMDSLDLPSWDGVNVYLISAITRADNTVVALSGLGGDELFWGYPSFSMVPRLAQWSRWSSGVPLFHSLMDRAALNAYPGSRVARMRDLAHPGGSALHAAYYAYRGLFDHRSLEQLLRPEFSTGARFQPIRYLETLTGPLPPQSGNAVSVLELKGWMHYQLLRDSDVMSMAHSLELRVPFLDHPLVELMARIPSALKAQRGDMPKPLLLRALPKSLPTELWKRPKRGFTIPFEPWIRRELKSTVQETLVSSASPLREICSPQALQRVWDGFLAGKVRWTRVWTAFVLARWLTGLRESRPTDSLVVSGN